MCRVPRLQPITARVFPLFQQHVERPRGVLRGHAQALPAVHDGQRPHPGRRRRHDDVQGVARPGAAADAAAGAHVLQPAHAARVPHQGRAPGQAQHRGAVRGGLRPGVEGHRVRPGRPAAHSAARGATPNYGHFVAGLPDAVAVAVAASGHRPRRCPSPSTNPQRSRTAPARSAPPVAHRSRRVLFYARRAAPRHPNYFYLFRSAIDFVHLHAWAAAVHMLPRGR